MKTISELLASKISDEVILMFHRDGVRLEAGEPVSSSMIFRVGPDDGGHDNVIRRGHDDTLIVFDPDTTIREANLEGPYEGVTTYIMEEPGVDKIKMGPLLWPALSEHLKENPSDDEYRWEDLQNKVDELQVEKSRKNIADVIMSVAMLAQHLDINPDEAVWDRNRELLERIIATDSPRNPTLAE